MKTYTPTTIYEGDYQWPGLKEDENGSWVLLDEAQTLLQALKDIKAAKSMAAVHNLASRAIEGVE